MLFTRQCLDPKVVGEDVDSGAVCLDTQRLFLYGTLNECRNARSASIGGYEAPGLGFFGGPTRNAVGIEVPKKYEALIPEDWTSGSVHGIRIRMFVAPLKDTTRPSSDRSFSE